LATAGSRIWTLREIDFQVLPLTSPGAEQLDATEAVAFAAATNDCLVTAARRYPDRFAGFAHCRLRLQTLLPVSWSARSVYTVSRAR
jgi:predicted TIM-barrel fold metal-dependent hydrolase